jgi:tetratricopeptide (TPR) repeat protein
MTEKEISIQITRYINGELNDKEEDKLWELFLENRNYYDLFQTELNLADLYRNKSFRLDESDTHNRVKSPGKRYRPWIASLAALFLISAMLYIFMFSGDSTSSSYAITEIELTEMIGSEVFRDDSPVQGDLDQRINQALSLALSGNRAQATETLNSLTSEPLSEIQQVRVQYNLGILAYNEGNYDISLTNFETLIDQIPPNTPAYVTESAKWYISNIYLHQGKVDNSVRLLQDIASGEGSYAMKAKNLLSVLTNSN